MNGSRVATAAVPRVAICARVSSEHQAQEQTIASQVAALRERVGGDALTLQDELCFLDDGFSGTTLARPALERLRDTAYVGGFQKLYVHSPDRLARRYAWPRPASAEASNIGLGGGSGRRRWGEGREEPAADPVVASSPRFTASRGDRRSRPCPPTPSVYPPPARA